MQRAEDDAAIREIERWRDLECAKADLAARAQAVEAAIESDLATYDRGMELAAGDPVKEELVLRFVQDLNAGHRQTINRTFG